MSTKCVRREYRLAPNGRRYGKQRDIQVCAVLGFGRKELFPFRQRPLAALIALERCALALPAAIRRFFSELATAEAVEGLDKQKHCQQTDCDVNASTHPALSIPNHLRVSEV